MGPCFMHFLLLHLSWSALHWKVVLLNPYYAVRSIALQGCSIFAFSRHLARCKSQSMKSQQWFTRSHLTCIMCDLSLTRHMQNPFTVKHSLERPSRNQLQPALHLIAMNRSCKLFFASFAEPPNFLHSFQVHPYIPQTKWAGLQVCFKSGQQG